jgi:hypothetical protein
VGKIHGLSAFGRGNYEVEEGGGFLRGKLSKGKCHGDVLIGSITI